MRVAVLGAGPIGLEAAIHAQHAGHEVVVFEAGEVGDSLRRWAHVSLFTPWSMNTSDLARAVLGDPRLGSSDLPTGAEMVERYLVPLAAHVDVRTGHPVLGVSRRRLRKGDALGSASRAEDPFHLVVGGAHEFSDVVLDCTGTSRDPAPAGLGGLPALGEGEAAAAGRVVYGPVRADPGQRAVVIGAGASGATVVTDLLDHHDGIAVTWVASGRVPAFTSPDDDPLPGRASLAAAARAASERVDHIDADIVAFETRSDGVVVRFADGRSVTADRAWVCAGFRPNHALSRELQVHVCWASEGPMRLAAALLAEHGGGGDCLAIEPAGAEVLRSPEPGFFILGSKSYGRRSDFLLRTGHQQVRDVIEQLLPRE